MSARYTFTHKGTEFEAWGDFEIGSFNVTSFVGKRMANAAGQPGATIIELETISAADEETLVQKLRERFGADTVISPAI